MALRPLTPHLRSIHYDARSAAKVQLVIQPGDELAVSDDVAAQLIGHSAQFKDGHARAGVAEVAEDEATPKGKVRPPAKPRARKG